LPEAAMNALRKVRGTSREGVLVDNGVFESDSEGVVSVRGALSGSCRGKRIHRPRFKDVV